MSGNADDAAIGALMLVANHNWKEASWLQRANVWLFGRREFCEHLGRWFKLGWINGDPYLISLGEVADGTAD